MHANKFEKIKKINNSKWKCNLLCVENEIKEVNYQKAVL